MTRVAAAPPVRESPARASGASARTTRTVGRSPARLAAIQASKTEPPGCPGLRRLEQGAGPALRLGDGERVGVGVVRGGELGHLVADGHAQQVGGVGQAARELADELRGGDDHLGVGEHVAPVPAGQPARHEVEAREVSLQRIDHDVEPHLRGHVDHGAHVVQGARADEAAVGLEEGPQREDPHVVGADVAQGGEVLADGVEVEVQPGVEPPLARRVVDPEAHGAGEGSGGLRHRRPSGAAGRGARARGPAPPTGPLPIGHRGLL